MEEYTRYKRFKERCIYGNECVHRPASLTIHHPTESTEWNVNTKSVIQSKYTLSNGIPLKIVKCLFNVCFVGCFFLCLNRINRRQSKQRHILLCFEEHWTKCQEMIEKKCHSQGFYYCMYSEWISAILCSHSLAK